MMKLHHLSLIISVSFLASITTADAIPLYYTFEGVASQTSHNQTNSSTYSNLMGVSLGDPVSYVFFVDDSVSSGVQPDGSFQNYGYSVSYPASTIRHEFLYSSKLISGTGLSIDNQTPNAVFDGQFDYSSSVTSPYYETPAWSELGFFGYADNGTISIWTEPTINQSSLGGYDDLVAWVANNPFGIMNSLRLSDDAGSSHFFDHYLSLTSISVTAPNASVPEPSVLYLMGIGLLGIGYLRTRELFSKS
ncbi:MAG: PEP-CTERM sorting domain-containing protein [Candidatus Thiodiazotropha sp. 6PLUC9]